MKKARIMLMAIAVFAVVGGAFAFKAKHFFPLVSVFTYTTSDSPLGGQCAASSTEEKYKTTTPNAPEAFTTTVSLAANANTTTCTTWVLSSAE